MTHQFIGPFMGGNVRPTTTTMTYGVYGEIAVIRVPLALYELSEPSQPIWPDNTMLSRRRRRRTNIEPTLV